MTKAIWAAIVVILVSVSVAVVAPPPARAGSAANEQVLLGLINSVRAQHGLPRLALRPSLVGAARAGATWVWAA